MRMKPLVLCQYEETGRDELNNPTLELTKISSSQGRFSSWTNEEIEVEGRDVTKDSRKIVTIASREKCEQADRILFENRLYRIKEVRGDESTRWRLLLIDKHGNEPDEPIRQR